jgi:DNA helicase INO80
MAEQRVVQMRERKAMISAEMQNEQQHRALEQQERSARLHVEDEKRTVKEREKEERLKKQRDAARRKREEEKAKREHDNEQRRARAEEARLAKIAEAERYSNLTPEERDAEDRAKAEQIARDREEAAAKIRETEEELLTSGRGARKRQRRASSGFDGEDGTPSGIGRYAEYEAYDDHEDEEDAAFEAPSSKSHKKKVRRPSASADPYATVPAGIFMAPDGSYCDAQGLPVEWPPASASRQGSPFLGSDDGVEAGPAGPGPKSHKKKPPLTPEELEKKVWMQIAKRDIPKVHFPIPFLLPPHLLLSA